MKLEENRQGDEKTRRLGDCRARLPGPLVPLSPCLLVSFPPARRAFVMADAVMALVIVGLLAAAMSVALGRQARATQRLADERAATWAAERVLSRLQSGGARDEQVDVDGAGIRIDPAEGGETPAGHAWVRVRAEGNGRKASLVGLVPGDRVEKEAASAPAGKGGSQ